MFISDKIIFTKTHGIRGEDCIALLYETHISINRYRDKTGHPSSRESATEVDTIDARIQGNIAISKSSGIPFWRSQGITYIKRSGAFEQNGNYNEKTNVCSSFDFQEKLESYEVIVDSGPVNWTPKIIW